MANILVVDDSSIDREIIKIILVQNGHNIIEAANGKEAMAHLQANPIDIVVTDIFMPEMDGLELAMEVRKSSATKGLIAISSGGRVVKGMQYLEHIKEFGADLSLEKPIVATTLINALDQILTKDCCHIAD